MDKQTTLEEFEKGMTENLSYLQRNTKEGKYVWTKSHVCNPERSFSRSWKMTLCMWGEEGYVKEATFSHLRPLTAIRWRQWKRGWNPHGDCPNPHVSGWCAYHHFQGC